MPPLQDAAISPTAPAAWHERGTLTETAATDVARWWLQLGDAQLTELVEAAIARNPDLAATRASLREARARLRGTAAALGPEIGASATAGRVKAGRADSREDYSLGVDASWELDLFGAQRQGVAAATADLRRAAAQLDNAHASLAAEVALRYVALRSAQQRLSLAQANLDSQSETVQITEWRVRAGLASSVELEQARSSREQTAATIPALQSSAATALHALAALTASDNATLAARLATSAALPAVPPAIAVDIPADTLRRRPDLRAAEQALLAETARSGVAAAARYPSLRLSGSLGSDALTLGALGGATTLTRSLVAALGATLFDGGRLEAQYAAQQEVQAQALHGYEAALLTAVQEVEDALSEFDRNGAREQALGRAAEAARNAALLARQRYRSGLIDFQTVLDTERSLRAVQDSQAAASAERLSSLVQLYKALGGGWSPADNPDAGQRSPS